MVTHDSVVLECDYLKLKCATSVKCTDFRVSTKKRSKYLNSILYLLHAKIIFWIYWVKLNILKLPVIFFPFSNLALENFILHMWLALYFYSILLVFMTHLLWKNTKGKLFHILLISLSSVISGKEMCIPLNLKQLAIAHGWSQHFLMSTVCQILLVFHI